MGLLYQIKQTWSPKFFLSTIWPSFEKRNNKRLCCFDIKRLTSCRITMKRSQDHSQKTQRPGTIDSDKKCANMLLRVRKQNTLFEKFVCIFRSKEIVLLAESEYSSKRFFTIRKLQIGFSKSTPGVMIKDLLFFGWAIAFFFETVASATCQVQQYRSYKLQKKLSEVLLILLGSACGWLFLSKMIENF